MNFEEKIKTSVAFGGVTVAMMTGSVYGESFLNGHYSDVENRIVYISGVEINTFTSGQTLGSNVNAFTSADAIEYEKYKEDINKIAILNEAISKLSGEDVNKELFAEIGEIDIMELLDT